MTERYPGGFPFGSRWSLAPLHVGLVFGLVAIVIKSIDEIYAFAII
jgi:uncharacterized membrane protein YqhA